MITRLKLMIGVGYDEISEEGDAPYGTFFWIDDTSTNMIADDGERIIFRT